MAGVKGRFGLQHIPVLRAFSLSGTLTPRLNLLTTRMDISQSRSKILTARRTLAGRSPSSVTSTQYSYNTSEVASPSTTSFDIVGLTSDCTSAYSEPSLHSQLRPESMQRHSLTSRSLSSETCSSPESEITSEGRPLRSNCRSENPEKPREFIEVDSRSGRNQNNTTNGSSPFEPTRRNKTGESSPELSKRSEHHGIRRSRWDDYQASKRLTTTPSSSTRHHRATSVSVEHRGDSTLIDNDREFMELKRNKSAQKEWNKRFPEGTIVVYTDGSCIDNRASGFGVYFGPNHELNRSEKIIGPIHNSGLAEILAAQMALRSLRYWRGYRNEPVILRTDFLPLVQAMSGVTCDRFAEEVEEVRSLAMLFPNGVHFEHVYAHDGDPGNEQADALARIATAPARRSRSASVPRFRNSTINDMRSRSRSRYRGRALRRRSRSATREYNRSRSRNNDPHHVRSHSAFVPGRRR